MKENSVKKECQEKRMSGKKMNIYDALDFSEGASYAVMCYNLYGNGTEPGTKADLENINLYDGEMKGEVE